MDKQITPLRLRQPITTISEEKLRDIRMDGTPEIGRQYLWQRRGDSSPPILVTIESVPSPDSMSPKAGMCQVTYGCITRLVNISDLSDAQ